MTLKLDSPYHKQGELIWTSDYNVVRVLSGPKLVMYAPHWKLLYYITQLDYFKEGYEYEIEKA